MRHFFLMAAVILAASPACPQERVPGSSVYMPLCPYGSTYSDGCAGANLNGFYQTTLSALAQSGQAAYATRPPWNIAGVDYPVGHDKTLTLKDPATATLPSGCAWDAADVKIDCENGNNITLDGFNLSATGGHICTQIWIAN